MVRVSLFKEQIGLDLSISTTGTMIRENYSNTDAGRWISKKNILLHSVPQDDYENLGLILEFFAYMSEEDAVEFIMRFK